MVFEDKIERGSFTGATAADVVEVSLPGMSGVMVQLGGTFTATITFEVLVDEGTSPTWRSISAVNTATGAAATTATAAGIYQANVSGSRRFRARCSAFTSGPVTVAVNVSRGSAGSPATTIAGGGPITVAGTTAGGAAETTNSISIGFVGTGGTHRNATAAPSVNNTTGTDVLGVGPMLKGTTNFFNMAGDDSGRAAIATGTIGPAKAEDAGHTSGDMGMFVLEVRNDTPGTLVNTDLDYAPAQQDSKGQSRVVAAGYTDVISTTLTRPGNTTAYTAGDEITDTGGAIQTLTGIARYSGGTGSIQGIYLSFSDNWAVKPTIRVWIFDTTSTPQTDNAAFAPSDGELNTALGFIDITNSAVADATANTGNMAMDTGLINFPFKTSGSANLFLRYQITNAGQAGANSSTIKARVRVSCD